MGRLLIRACLFWLAGIAALGVAHCQPIPLIVTSNGAPTSGCGANQLNVDTTTGLLYSCGASGSWQATNVFPTGTSGAALTAGAIASGNSQQSKTIDLSSTFSNGASLLFRQFMSAVGTGTFQVPTGGTYSFQINGTPAFSINGTGIGSTAFTATMPTGLLTTGTCAAAVQVAITGASTSSVVLWDYASDPSGVVGYGSSGGLTITAFGTSGNVNFRQCNSTAGSITPGAMTLNVRLLN